MGIDPKAATTKSQRLSGELGFTRTPSEDDPRRDPHLLEAIAKIAPGTALRAAVDDVIRSHEGALIVLGDPMHQLAPWIRLLAAFDAIYWSLCGLLFGRVVEE